MSDPEEDPCIEYTKERIYLKPMHIIYGSADPSVNVLVHVYFLCLHVVVPSNTVICHLEHTYRYITNLSEVKSS